MVRFCDYKSVDVSILSTRVFMLFLNIVWLDFGFPHCKKVVGKLIRLYSYSQSWQYLSITIMPVTIQRIKVIHSKYEWAGYHFSMSDPSKNITCKISNSANCCEQFGIYTKCKLQDFVGAEYYSVNVSKTVDSECGSISATVNVSIETDRGTILVQLYNEHNGYYEHEFYTQTEYSTKIESL